MTILEYSLLHVRIKFTLGTICKHKASSLENLTQLVLDLEFVANTVGPNKHNGYIGLFRQGKNSYYLPQLS